MKLVTAVVKPAKLDDVKQALREVGTGMTVTEVHAFSRETYSIGDGVMDRLRRQMVIYRRLTAPSRRRATTIRWRGRYREAAVLL